MDNHSESKQIKIGVIMSYLSLGVSTLIPIFYTPVMLRLLGQSEYGLNKIASSTTSFLGLMSFGVGSALSRYLIKARMEEGKEAEEKIFGLFMLLFQAIAVLTIAVGAFLVFRLDQIYGKSLTATELSKIKILVALMVATTAISFASSPYNAVVSSHERFVFIQTINLVTTIGAPVINLIVLFMGYKSIGMAASSLGVVFLVRLSYILYVKKELGMKPRFHGMPLYALKEIVVFSFWIFVGDLVDQLYHATDTVIIGMVPGLATIGAAVYGIGATFSNMMVNLSIVIPGFFTPKANKMVFGGSSNKELTDLVIQTGRIQAAIIVLVCTGFVVFGRQFIQLYAGTDYWEAYWVAVIIMIPSSIPLVQSTALSILQAKNLHKYRSIMLFGIAICNVAFTALLVPKYGIIGAAIPTGGALILGQGIYLNLIYEKKVGLNIGRFWKSLLPFFIVGVIMCIGASAVSYIVDFYILWKMIVGIVVYSIVYILILWLGVLNSEEKNMITDTLKRMKNRKTE